MIHSDWSITNVGTVQGTHHPPEQSGFLQIDLDKEVRYGFTVDGVVALEDQRQQ